MAHRPPAKMLGPSNVGTVLGLNPWRTVDQLRCDMENGYTVNDTQNEFMCAGTRDESTVKALYTRETGRKIHSAGFRTDEKNSRFGGCADGLLRGGGGIEIKCRYGTSINVAVRDIDVVQAVSYMYLYGKRWWDIVIYHASAGGGKMTIATVHWDDYADSWKTVWYPAICEFIASVKWNR